MQRGRNKAEKWIKWVLICVLSTCALGIPMVILVGCGGGSTAPPSLPPTPQTLFTPNYVDSLTREGQLLHWSHLPLRVYFNLPSTWTSRFPADMPATATNSWNWSGQQLLLEIVTSPTDADVPVTFVNSPPASWSTGAIAQTNYSYDPSTNSLIPGHCTIIISLRTSSGAMLGTADIQHSIAHEFGHALGIGGHSPNPTDLMYPIATVASANSPTIQDMNTVKTAYPAYFGGRSAPENARSTEPPVHTSIN